MNNEMGRLKTESYSKPEKLEILASGNNKALIIFAENIEEVTKPVRTTLQKKRASAEEQSETIYLYDRYTLTVPDRNGLIKDVLDNYDDWLGKAKQADYDAFAEQVRAERDKLLAETDKEFALDRINLNIPEKVTASTMLNAVKDIFAVLGSVCNGEMAKYRQALRDIPQQEGFPYNVNFPAKPKY